MARKIANVAFNKLMLLNFSVIYGRELVPVFTIIAAPFDVPTVAFAKFVEICAERNRIVQYFSCAILMATGGYLNLDQGSTSFCSWLYPAFAVITMALALQSILLSSFYVSCLNYIALDRNLISAWVEDAHPMMSAGLLNVPSALALAPALSIWSGLCFACFRLAYVTSKTLTEYDGQYKVTPAVDGRPVTSAILTGFIALSFMLTTTAMKRVSRLGTTRVNPS